MKNRKLETIIGITLLIIGIIAVVFAAGYTAKGEFTKIWLPCLVLGVVLLAVIAIARRNALLAKKSMRRAKTRAYAREVAKRDAIAEAERLAKREAERGQLLRQLTSQKFISQPYSYPAATEFDSVMDCLTAWNDISRKKRSH